MSAWHICSIKVEDYIPSLFFSITHSIFTCDLNQKGLDDPLIISDEAMTAGYNFFLKKSTKSHQYSRKRSTSKGEKDDLDTSSPTKRRKSAKSETPDVKASTKVVSPSNSTNISASEKHPSIKSQCVKAAKIVVPTAPPVDATASPSPRPYISENSMVIPQKAKEMSANANQAKRLNLPYQPQGMNALPVPTVGGSVGSPYGQQNVAEKQAAYHRYMKQREAMQMQQQQQQQQAQAMQNSTQKDNFNPQQRHLQQLQHYHQQQAQMQMLRQHQFAQQQQHVVAQQGGGQPHPSQIVANKPPGGPPQMPSMPQFPMAGQPPPPPMGQMPPVPGQPGGSFPGQQMPMRGGTGGAQQVLGTGGMPGASSTQAHPPGQPQANSRNRGGKDEDDMNDPLLMLFKDSTF